MNYPPVQNHHSPTMASPAAHSQRSPSPLLHYQEPPLVNDAASALHHQLKFQIEFYFSQHNLMHDKYLQENLRHPDHYGSVPIATICSFRKVREIYASFSAGRFIHASDASPADPLVVRAALQNSIIVGVSEDGHWLFPIYVPWQGETAKGNASALTSPTVSPTSFDSGQTTCGLNIDDSERGQQGSPSLMQEQMQQPQFYPVNFGNAQQQHPRGPVYSTPLPQMVNMSPAHPAHGDTPMMQPQQLFYQQGYVVPPFPHASPSNIPFVASAEMYQGAPFVTPTADGRMMQPYSSPAKTVMHQHGSSPGNMMSASSIGHPGVVGFHGSSLNPNSQEFHPPTLQLYAQPQMNQQPYVSAHVCNGEHYVYGTHVPPAYPAYVDMVDPEVVSHYDGGSLANDQQLYTYQDQQLRQHDQFRHCQPVQQYQGSDANGDQYYGQPVHHRHNSGSDPSEEGLQIHHESKLKRNDSHNGKGNDYDTGRHHGENNVNGSHQGSGSVSRSGSHRRMQNNGHRSKNRGRERSSNRHAAHHGKNSVARDEQASIKTQPMNDSKQQTKAILHDSCNGNPKQLTLQNASPTGTESEHIVRATTTLFAALTLKEKAVNAAPATEVVAAPAEESEVYKNSTAAANKESPEGVSSTAEKSSDSGTSGSLGMGRNKHGGLTVVNDSGQKKAMGESDLVSLNLAPDSDSGGNGDTSESCVSVSSKNIKAKGNMSGRCCKKPGEGTVLGKAENTATTAPCESPVATVAEGCQGTLPYGKQSKDVINHNDPHAAPFTTDTLERVTFASSTARQAKVSATGKGAGSPLETGKHGKADAVPARCAKDDLISSHAVQMNSSAATGTKTRGMASSRQPNVRRYWSKKGKKFNPEILSSSAAVVPAPTNVSNIINRNKNQHGATHDTGGKDFDVEWPFPPPIAGDGDGNKTSKRQSSNRPYAAVAKDSPCDNDTKATPSSHGKNMILGGDDAVAAIKRQATRPNTKK
ncbi:hypothetical protein MPSEU_000093400 [Mayamaea pseudoterrestris]|nr:hypothetical protein MPSEU_000093400 [Mayamaea pseudoterrestris]